MTPASAQENGRFHEAADLLDEGVRDEAYAAAVLLVGRDDEVLFERSAGYARSASLFDIASLTKPLTAALFFVLSQEGHLSPDGIAAEVLPFTSPDPRTREIRFVHLLSHTSGLPAWLALYRKLAVAETAKGRPLSGVAEGHDRILAEVLSLPLSRDPGAGWEYSDLGFMLLGRAIEVAGFRSLDRLLTEMVTGPLGMRETLYLPLAGISECETGRLIPTGWSEVRQREKIGEVDDENAAAMGGVAGHAGLFSTAGDLFLFAREIVRARKGEGRVLTRPSAVGMTTRVARPPGCPRTLGFDTPTPPHSSPKGDSPGNTPRSSLKGLAGRNAVLAGRGLGSRRRRRAPRLHRLLDVDRSGPGDLGDPADQPRGVRKRQPEAGGASPPDPRRRLEGDRGPMNVHLIAACGVGMASLAGMLKEKGFRVSGSDANVYPPMSTQLESLGIRLASPYAAENIPPDADLVVVGNAVSRGNPEAEEAVRRGVPMLSMPQAIARFFIGERESIVVAGTHGKTTTTSLAAWSLFDLGADPSFLVGGVPKNFPVSYRLGQGRQFVIEGDEYDTAYFDKGPKFLHYRPRIVLLTSVEFDHADIYRDLGHVLESFRKLTAILPPDGLLVACADYPDVVAVAREARCPVIFYATRDDAISEGRDGGVVGGPGDRRVRRDDRVPHGGERAYARLPLPPAGAAQRGQRGGRRDRPDAPRVSPRKDRP